MKKFIMILIIIGLSACGGASIKNVQSSEKPKMASKPKIIDLTSVKSNNFNALATNYMNKMIRPMMKDPASMKLKLSGKLEKEICEDKGKKYKTWNTLVGINAKNSYR